MRFANDLLNIFALPNLLGAAGCSPWLSRPLTHALLPCSKRQAPSRNFPDSSGSLQRVGWVGKRSLDVSVAGLALFLLLPLLVVLCLLIWASDGHTPIFRHKRIGRNGQPFGCLKFRSMVVNADAVLQDHLARNPAARAEWVETHKLSNDPRVTPLGQILRKTSLDELPQLINVLKGELSLVGPRPIVEAEAERYGSAFATCFSVTPGVTGLWQVSGRSDCSYAERVALRSAIRLRVALLTRSRHPGPHRPRRPRPAWKPVEITRRNLAVSAG